MIDVRTQEREGRLTKALRALPCAEREEPPPWSGGGFRIQVANTRALRERAYRLVYGAYAARGYEVASSAKQRLWFHFHHCNPDAITFLAERNGQEVATLTLVPDSELGLPADDLFPEAITNLRARGRKACEICSLAVAELSEHDGRKALLHLFRFAYLSAAYLLEGADLVACVMAHHGAFYRRALLFDEVSAETVRSPKTGAHVRWARLDLARAPERYARHYGRQPGERNLHCFFVNDEVPGLLDWLRRQRRPLAFADLVYFGVEMSEVLKAAGPQARARLQDRYLLEDWEQLIARIPA